MPFENVDMMKLAMAHALYGGKLAKMRKERMDKLAKLQRQGMMWGTAGRGIRDIGNVAAQMSVGSPPPPGQTQEQDGYDYDYDEEDYTPRYPLYARRT